MTIQDWQQRTDQWIKDYGVRYFSEMTNMVILTEEVGELARLMARKYGEQSFKHTEEEERVDINISDELADIIFVVTCLANQMDIDLTAALNKNIEKKTNRDKNRHQDNKKL